MTLLFGYQGTGFFGLQSQRAEGTPDQPTVSDVLRQALLRSGAILETNLATLTRTKWSIASRTDKGVHAARAAVSLKMETVDAQLEPLAVEADCLSTAAAQRVQLTAEAIATINSHLPAEVRLFGGSNVRKSFDARECASSRTYEYLLPRAALCGMPVHQFDAVLRQFEGSHKVHNFCSGLRKKHGEWEHGGEAWPLALDPRRSQSQAYRSVVRCGVRRTLTIAGHDYLVLQISGISFVLHQIRHMIGTALAIAHGLVPPDVLPLALRSPLEINISPLAPATGLLLDQVPAAHFTSSPCLPPQVLPAAPQALPTRGARGSGTARRLDARPKITTACPGSPAPADLPHPHSIPHLLFFLLHVHSPAAFPPPPTPRTPLADPLPFFRLDSPPRCHPILPLPPPRCPSFFMM